MSSCVLLRYVELWCLEMQYFEQAPKYVLLAEEQGCFWKIECLDDDTRKIKWAAWEAPRRIDASPYAQTT